MFVGVILISRIRKDEDFFETSKILNLWKNGSINMSVSESVNTSVEWYEQDGG